MMERAPDIVFTSNSHAWLAAIVDSSDDAIIGKTLDSVIRSWNRGAARMFGYTPDEIIGRSVLTLIPPELQYEEAAIVSRLTKGERVDHYETVRMRQDGTRIEISLSVSPIRDASGAIVGAAKIARDITEAKRLLRAERELAEQLQELAAELEQQIEESQALQADLEQSNEELVRSLEQAERARRHEDLARRQAEEASAAKSQFLATMSHELRTPLNAIAGYVDLLDMGLRGPLTIEQQQDLRRIKRSQQSLLRLIDNLLSFAKLESGRLELDYAEVKLDDFLATLDTFVAPKLGEKRLRYTVDSCGAGVTVTIDQAKVEQVLINLIANAVKFTDEGRIHVACQVDDDTVGIEVRDTGRGIRPELLEKIFEPFEQGDRSLTRTAEGAGLGLSISRQLGRAMGGDITVESALGKGSVFKLTLPRYPLNQG
jgi:PAS domain S-box